jgi:hypothetical protein
MSQQIEYSMPVNLFYILSDSSERLFQRLRPVLTPKIKMTGPEREAALDIAQKSYRLNWQYLFNSYRRSAASSQMKKVKKEEAKKKKSDGQKDESAPAPKKAKTTSITESN